MQPMERGSAMESSQNRWQRPGSWIGLGIFAVLVLFLLFYQPVEQYLMERIPQIHFSNILFWFASVVAIISFAISHRQSFKKNIFDQFSEISAQELVFDTLQIAILAAVILCAGATIQAVEMLSEHLMNDGQLITAVFGSRLLSVFVLMLMAILFYLLHRVVRAYRVGWRRGWTPPGAVGRG